MADLSEDLETQLDAAEQMIAQGEYEQAFLMLNRLSEQYPESPDVALLLGDAELSYGDLEAALEQYDRAVELDPEWPEAYGARAYCLVELGKLEEAEEDVETALELNPDLAQAYYVKAIILEFQRKRRRADEAYRKAHALDPETYFVPVRLSRAAFDKAVLEAISRLPDDFRDRMKASGIEIFVRDLPEKDLYAKEGLSLLVLGMFVGHPIFERRDSDPWSQFPPHVVLFQRNIERVCRTREDLILEIEVTVLHEVGHFFGLEEEELSRLHLS